MTSPAPVIETAMPWKAFKLLQQSGMTLDEALSCELGQVVLDQTSSGVPKPLQAETTAGNNHGVAAPSKSKKSLSKISAATSQAYKTVSSGAVSKGEKK